MKNKETVCAIVVTYNRKKLLIECLDGLMKQTRQLEAIYLIDNCSNDGTAELLLENGYLDKLPPANILEPFEIIIDYDNSQFLGAFDDGIENKEAKIKIYYVRMNENTGGAGGFYEGVKRGYEKGYDWLWLMDDDVEPIYNGLERLFTYTNISESIQPSRIYENGDRAFWSSYIEEDTGYTTSNKDLFINDKNWECVNVGCFEGLFFKAKLTEKVGYPEKKLFFVADDTLYGYRLSKVSNLIYIKDVALTKKIDKRNNEFSNLALYLEFRNRLGYVSRTIAKRKKLYYIRSMVSVLKYITISLYKLEFKKSIICIKGYFHGVKEIWGKEKEYL